MTRPHPVGGKARTRKPETVLDEVVLRFRGDVPCWCLDSEHRSHRRLAGCPRTLLDKLLAELRRSLRDTRGAK